MPPIFIIERCDFPSDDDDDREINVSQTKFVAAHTTLEAANKHAKVLFHRIYRDEGDDGDAAAKIEVDNLHHGTYVGKARLMVYDDPGALDSVTITVLEKELYDETWSPFVDEEDELEFMKSTGGLSSDEDNDGGDSEEAEGNGESEEGEEGDNSPPPKATGKHARTSSATVADDGAKKKAKRTNAK